MRILRQIAATVIAGLVAGYALAGVYDWSKTAASNTTLESISWAEGMAPSGVNNGVRAIAAALKKWQEDIGCAVSTTGSSGAFVLDANSDPTAYADGDAYCFVANMASVGSGSDTLNVESVGAKAIRKFDSSGEVDLDANDILSSGHYVVTYDASADSAAGAWILHNPLTIGGTINDSNWSGTDLTVANGGTGASSLTDGGVLVGSGTGAVTALTVGTDGQLLIGASAADPAFATLTCGAGLTCTGGTNTLTIAEDADAIVIACSDETTALTTGTAKITFRMPYALTVTGISASLSTASSSGTVTIDVNEGDADADGGNGATIMATNKLNFDANETTTKTYSGTAAAVSDTALAADAEMTIDIDSAGTGAKGCKVTILGTRA